MKASVSPHLARAFIQFFLEGNHVTKTQLQGRVAFLSGCSPSVFDTVVLYRIV